MTYSLFDTVVVPFPYTDRATARRRPALVVSSEAFNRSHDHVILAMITTAAHSPWASDIPLAEPAKAGLRVPCIVRFKLFTLERSLIAKSLGRLAAADAEAMTRALADRLGGGENR